MHSHDSRDSYRTDRLPYNYAMKSIPVMAFRRPAALLLALLSSTVAVVHAENVVNQPPNVRMEYAEVLRVEPVYQTLRAYATEERCDPPVSVIEKPLARMASAMNGALSEKDRGEQGGATVDGRNCRPMRVAREFRRPIAYDVDYIHRGVKYRSRLPFDPGKRLRVKVSVTPDITPADK